MPPTSNRSNKRITALVIFVLICVAVLVFIVFHKKTPIAPVVVLPAVTATSTYEVIGTSVQGRKIEAYTFGTGSKQIVFAGGMHGGYEWNAVTTAYDLIDY